MGTQLSKPVVDKHTVVRAGGDGLRYAASSMQGYRRDNEDQHTLVPNLEGLPSHSFLAIFDGHGGKDAAAAAAQTLLEHVHATTEWQEYVLKYSQQDTAPEEKTNESTAQLLGKSLVSAFISLDSAMATAGNSAQVCDGSGSTAVAVFITPSHFVCASVGDSRAVVACTENGTEKVAAPLSHDHKPSLPAEAERIQAAGGCVIGNRVDGTLAMSRALGDFELKNMYASPYTQKVSPVPDIQIRKRDDSDEMLVVACDGVWDVMSNTACCTCLRSLLATGESNLGMVAEELLDLCLEAGSTDNISAILVALPGAKYGAGDGILARRKARDAARRAEEEREAQQLALEVEQHRQRLRAQARASCDGEDLSAQKKAEQMQTAAQQRLEAQASAAGIQLLVPSTNIVSASI